jgi:hypothetical protein
MDELARPLLNGHFAGVAGDGTGADAEYVIPSATSIKMISAARMKQR